MSLRKSTRLKTIKEESKISFTSSSDTVSKSKNKTMRRSVRANRLKKNTDAQSPIEQESQSRKLTTTKKNTKRITKPVSPKKSSSSEKVLTPPTPEITSAILKKKPWLSNEFLVSLIDQLKSPSTEPKEHPKMLSLVGPMAAGKTTVKHQLQFNDAVNLDVDEVRIIATREFGEKARGIFVDFAKIIQLLGMMIINDKYDFILDTTGKMKEPIKYVMKQAKAAGYTIDIAIVYSTRELCEKRAQHRNITYTAREPVSLPVVGKVYDEFKDTKRAKSYIMGIKDIVNMTDNLYLFDNSRCTPEAALIMEKHGNNMIVHEDFPDFYGVSVSQLSPKLVALGNKKTSKHRKTRKH